MNIVNPTNFVYLDVIYYMILVFGGPCLLWDFFYFRPQRKVLHDAYRQSGVEIRALVTRLNRLYVQGLMTSLQ